MRNTVADIRLDSGEHGASAAWEEFVTHLRWQFPNLVFRENHSGAGQPGRNNNQKLNLMVVLAKRTPTILFRNQSAPERVRMAPGASNSNQRSLGVDAQ